eukprot:COSAG02_NODE_3115_length_7335_cov_2.741017_6_plen_212_part_00
MHAHAFRRLVGTSSCKDRLLLTMNLLNQELDTSGEWFFDPKESTLSFWPNTTDGSAGKEVVAPLLSTIVRIEGAKDVTFNGFRFTETRSTFLDQYEVPSGGDWSVHRGATFEIIDSSGVEVSDSVFDQIGGNGVLLSNAVDNSRVTGNEFVNCGDSAVVSIGSSNGIDGTAQTYPRGNVIKNNHMHEIGTSSFPIVFAFLCQHEMMTYIPE